jgi:hypothetical protein
MTSPLRRQASSPLLQRLALVALASAGCATAGPTSRAPAAPLAASRVMPLYPVTDASLPRIPTHVTRDHVAVCDRGDTCDVWTRDGRHLGAAPYEGVVDRWATMDATGTTKSPSGAFELVTDDDGRWQLSTRDHAFVGPLPEDCTPERAVWAPSDMALALPCATTVVVLDTRTAKPSARLQTPEGCEFDGKLVWSSKLHLALRDARGDVHLASWTPGAEATTDYPTIFGFDPVTLETWTDVPPPQGYGNEIIHAHDPGPGHAATTLSSYLPTDRGPTFVWNLTGTAFAKLEPIPDNDSYGISVEFANIGGASPRGGVSKSVPDQARLEVLAQPTPRGDRAVPLVAVSESESDELDTLTLFTPEGETDLPSRELTKLLNAKKLALVVEEERAFVRADGRVFVQPLNGVTVGHWMSAAESAAWSIPASQERFSTRDGVVVTRLADSVSLSLSQPCWWPEGWYTGSARVAVRVGDAFAARLLPDDVVTRTFCGAEIVSRFVHGDPMPVRPDAFIAFDGAR